MAEALCLMAAIVLPIVAGYLNQLAIPARYRDEE